MKTKVLLSMIIVLLLLFTGMYGQISEVEYDYFPVFNSHNVSNKIVTISDSSQKIKFNFTYDASSIEKIFNSPDKVLVNIPSFWENENAYRLMKSWHRYNNIPIDYEGWKNTIEKIATIPFDQRVDNPGYALVNEIIGAKETFIKKAIPHICSFLPKRDLSIDTTAYFVAFTYARGIGVGDRIAIDIFNSYYRGNLSMILNTMVHELYHTGFGHVQFARTDPEFENPAIKRMLSDFQNEGITTYVAYKAQTFFPAPHEKDYSMLENKKTVFKLIKRLNKLFIEAETLPADQLQKKSWDLGVQNRAYYVVGAHLAQTIDEKRGRDTLNETILKGSTTFIRTYNALVDKNMQIYELEPPANPSIFEHLRYSAVNQDYNKYNELLAELKKKAEIDQSREDIFLKIGLVFMQQKKNDLAIDLLKFNADLFPASAAAFNFLGKAYLQKGNKVLALENFQKSVALDPEYVDAIENLKKLQK